jgi:hypothetical protein
MMNRGRGLAPGGTLPAASVVAVVLCLVVLASPQGAAASTPSIAVSPKTGIVGSTITIAGSGFPPDTNVTLGWASQNASWEIKANPTPQVIGISSQPLVYGLGSAGTNSSGSFLVQVKVPADYGGAHVIQAYAANGTAISPVASFTVVPHFDVNPTSGPAGTPINVTATGLGTGIYDSYYHFYWDNSYVGYLTAVTTHGSTSFTVYASGTPGPHYIAVYQGYPGPGYFNPQQNPSPGQYAPPNIPFYANFTVTPENVVLGSGSSSPADAVSGYAAEFGAMALLGAAAGGAFFVARKGPDDRRAISRTVIVLVIVLLVAIGGIGAYVVVGQPGSPAKSSGPQVTFSPVATVDRPQIAVPLNNATTGPRISVTPDIAGVGANVTVAGMGFAPNSHVPLVWTTRQGNNLNGYKLVSEPLRNVTADGTGSFSFTMKVPSDLGGIHYIAAGNLTEHSNGTLFLQRTAAISTTHGPDGTKIVVTIQGVGWDFNTNIATIDYDNSYEGFGCGFNTGGNVTFTIIASGAPGIHTIDVFPSVWWGPSTYANQQAIEYRYPLLTPQDHPELMPSFSFTFLVTSG